MNPRVMLSLSTLVTLLAAEAKAPASAPEPNASAALRAMPASSSRSFEEEPPPADKSAAPEADEWKPALPIALTRGVPACRAYRLREWLKIHCDGFPAAGVSLLAGPAEGVIVWVDPSNEGNSIEVMKKPRAAEVMFPVRRGDGRVVQFAQFGEGYDGPVGWNAAYTVSEQWLPGEPAPIITVF